MPRPTDVRRLPLAEAIKALREEFGETQEEFARRLRVTVGSVARYETNYRPSTRVLRRLKDLASQAGRLELERMFGKFWETGNERDVALVMAMERFVRTADERRYPAIERLLSKEIDQWVQTVDEAKDDIPTAIRVFLSREDVDGKGR